MRQLAERLQGAPALAHLRLFSLSILVQNCHCCYLELPTLHNASHEMLLLTGIASKAKPCAETYQCSRLLAKGVIWVLQSNHYENNGSRKRGIYE